MTPDVQTRSDGLSSNEELIASDVLPSRCAIKYTEGRTVRDQYIGIFRYPCIQCCEYVVRLARFDFELCTAHQRTVRHERC